MKIIYKILIVLVVLLFINDTVFSSDFGGPSPDSLRYMMNTNENSQTYSNVLDGFTIFDENNTTVVRTKGKGFWSIFNKKNNKTKDDEPVRAEVEEFDNNDVPQEIEAEEYANKKNNSKKEIHASKKVDKYGVGNSDVDIYCDNMDYIETTKEVIGTGNAKVVFKENNSVLYADKLVYNHDMNYIEGIDNVKISRDGKTIDGDYAKIDLNYGNVMVDKPIINDYFIKIVAKYGNVTVDTLEAYDGIANFKADAEHRLYSPQFAYFFPTEIDDSIRKSFYPKEYRAKKQKYHIKTKEIYVNSTDGHDVVTFKNADIYIGKILTMKCTDVSFSTDKTQSFVETSFPEMGSARYVGAFFGPGFVLNTPLSSTLKITPLVSMDKNKFGVGVYGRFLHKRNITEAYYTTSANQLVLRGRQQLWDSDFFIEYARLSYMNDWFIGSNISKYLAQLTYNRQYDFPDMGMRFGHRATAGYLTDEFGNKGTARFRYQAEYSKEIVSYRNYDKKLYSSLYLLARGMMGVYGTGDATGYFGVGAGLRTQYRGWSQNISYMQSGQGGKSPLGNTDDYRYGHSTISILETLRLNRYLSVGVYGVLNLDRSDSYASLNGMLSEGKFLVSIGPDDAKLSFGYDILRQGTVVNYSALIGAKNNDVKFKKLLMKNPDKLGQEKESKPKKDNPFIKLFGFNDAPGLVPSSIDSIEGTMR